RSSGRHARPFARIAIPRRSPARPGPAAAPSAHGRVPPPGASARRG
ncbi:MAG: poly(3-hydroxybutyrate) depolymerase, partial [Alphaproteobacteria bacterium]|nr:poly(3-hydroxybutyrate) depolymerase [Alphaproteobacteria bacterium]